MWADNNVPTIEQCQPRTRTKGDEVHPGVDIAAFNHSICTRGNGVKFAHQSLCNPKISTLLKAVRHGFLCGCPNMTATAKGHMKRPRHGIRSTRRQVRSDAPTAPSIPVIPRLDTLSVGPTQHDAPVVVFPAPDSFFQPPDRIPNIIIGDDDDLVLIFFARRLSRTNFRVSCTLTSRVTSPSCRLTGMYVSSLFTITSPTQS